jgi:hypothetical protein
MSTGRRATRTERAISRSVTVRPCQEPQFHEVNAPMTVLVGPAPDAWIEALVQSAPHTVRLIVCRSRALLVRKARSSGARVLILGARDSDQLPTMPLIATHLRSRRPGFVICLHDTEARGLRTLGDRSGRLAHVALGMESHAEASRMVWRIALSTAVL